MRFNTSDFSLLNEQTAGDAYLLMIETPHSLLQKTTPVYTDPACCPNGKQNQMTHIEWFKRNTSGNLKY